MKCLRNSSEIVKIGKRNIINLVKSQICPRGLSVLRIIEKMYAWSATTRPSANATFNSSTFESVKPKYSENETKFVIVDRGKLLINKLLSQGYRRAKFVSIVLKFCARHHDLVDPYNVAVSKPVFDLLASVEAK